MTRGAVIDVDGTVARGSEPIPGAAAGVRTLREAGYELVFVSNNPTASPEAIADRLRTVGVEATADAVVTSGTVAREYVRATHADADVFLVGEAGLRAQLDGVALTDDPVAADVLVGSIDREFAYDDLTDALRALEDGTTAFVGTDPDATVPVSGTTLPGSGAILGAIEAATGVTPDVVGKPSRHVAAVVLDRLDADPADCVVVGDRLDTDVALGERSGMVTALVKTGVTRESDLADATLDPDHVLDSLADVRRIVTGR